MAIFNAVSMPVAGLYFLVDHVRASKFRDDSSNSQKNLKARNSEPSPLLIPASEYWDGVDGLWSSLALRIGTPSQNARVFVSTNSPETLVVLPAGCTSQAFDPGSIPPDCANSRGGLFDSGTSSTWQTQGYYGINGNGFGGDGVGFEANLDYTQTAEYGLETLALGYTGGPVLQGQTIAGIGTSDPFYMGIFGLGTQPVNYTSIGNLSASSYFVSLRSKNLIPSLSWSYTAGAKHRLKSGQYMQLIFGGYDTSRFTPNSATFNLAKDVDRDIVVAIQSIIFSTTDTNLLETPIYAFIESTDPNIWLPEAACQAFETAFGISLDNSTGMYLINDTHLTQLQTANPTVTFNLANSLSGGETVRIALPFSAFTLQANYPFTPNATHYFPLRVAANESQTTLGRVFLQEAYLTVDYDRGNFSVSQCTWNDGAPSDIVTIFSPSYRPTKVFGGGEIAGVVVAGVVFLATIAIGVWYYVRKRTTCAKAHPAEYSTTDKPELAGTEIPISGFYGAKHVTQTESTPQSELSPDSQIFHLPERLYNESVYVEEARRLEWQMRAGVASELASPSVLHEMDADGSPVKSPSVVSSLPTVLGPRGIDSAILTSPFSERRFK